jgi:peroxiredoxin
MRPLAAALLLAVAGAGCGAETSDWTPLPQPMAAPDFSLPRLGGGSLRLAELRGRVVLMEFWATWCAPCRYSTPSMDVTYRKFRGQGVEVLLINAGESEETVRQWAGARFAAPILLDRDGAAQAAFAVVGLPTLFVIDREGMIRYVQSGYAGGLERNLRVVLKDLLHG